LRIVARGGSSLPLPEETTQALAGALARFPEGISRKAMYVRAEGEGSSAGTRVFTFGGASLNRVVALALPRYLGKASRARYGDISVFFRGIRGSAGAESVASALQSLAGLSGEDFLALLPEPRDGGKFAEALPPDMRRQMFFSGVYHGPAVLNFLRSNPVRVLPTLIPHPEP